MTQYVLKLRIVSDDPELRNLYKAAVAKMETEEYRRKSSRRRAGNTEIKNVPTP